MSVRDQLDPPSDETCSAQPKNGVSIRFTTARLARRRGLRTTVGEVVGRDVARRLRARVDRRLATEQPQLQRVVEGAREQHRTDPADG